MTILDHEQGSRAWVEARLGIPTASQFSRLLTPKRMQVSAGRHRYRAELLAEWITGEPVEEFDTEWTERGRALEPMARSYYAIQRDVDVRAVGLCLRPVPCAPHLSVGAVAVGASPDGLVGDVGAVELKCPGMVKHILTCSAGGVPAAYRMQIQGQLWVTGRKWVDFMSYHPDAPEQILERVEPDPAVQQAFDDVIPAFVAELAEARRNLLDRGWKSWKDQHDELVEQQKTPMTYDEAKGEWVPWDGKQAEHERIMAEHDREEATR